MVQSFVAVWGKVSARLPDDETAGENKKPSGVPEGLLEES
jgi:hypothetical protein